MKEESFLKQITVSVPYPEAKIDALRHFTDSGKPPLEEEITALIDRLYARNVPAPACLVTTRRAACACL